VRGGAQSTEVGHAGHTGGRGEGFGLQPGQEVIDQPKGGTAAEEIVVGAGGVVEQFGAEQGLVAGHHGAGYEARGQAAALLGRAARRRVGAEHLHHGAGKFAHLGQGGVEVAGD
jgi:hypothetical protein